MATQAGLTAALNAYGSAARMGRMEPAMAARDTGGPSFGDVLQEAARSAVATQVRAERTSAAAIAGQADLTQVVAAVSSAEVTLQTVVAVRDRVIGAYQEILRMPI